MKIDFNTEEYDMDENWIIRLRRGKIGHEHKINDTCKFFTSFIQAQIIIYSCTVHLNYWLCSNLF